MITSATYIVSWERLVDTARDLGLSIEIDRNSEERTCVAKAFRWEPQVSPTFVGTGSSPESAFVNLVKHLITQSRRLAPTAPDDGRDLAISVLDELIGRVTESDPDNSGAALCRLVERAKKAREALGGRR